MDLIRMSHVKKTYKNGVTAIYDLNLKIKKGDFVFIIGSTGCGTVSYTHPTLPTKQRV